MATATRLERRGAGGRRERSPTVRSTTLFDWTVTLLSVWMTAGLYLDGWAHQDGRVDDTFFTPWHAVLYSGVFAMLLFLLFHQVRNMLRGAAGIRSAGWLPAINAGSAAVRDGGAVDMLWARAVWGRGKPGSIVEPHPPAARCQRSTHRQRAAPRDMAATQARLAAQLASIRPGDIVDDAAAVSLDLLHPVCTPIPRDVSRNRSVVPGVALRHLHHERRWRRGNAPDRQLEARGLGSRRGLQTAARSPSAALRRQTQRHRPSSIS